MSLLEVEHLAVRYATPRGTLHAVRDVSLRIAPGETVGLVGESGCGKSTLGRALMRLEPASAGSVRLEGEDLFAARGRALARLRTRVQMVFQDPFGSLNPRRRVGSILAQPLRLAGNGKAGSAARVVELLDRVGLAADAAERFPHEFSGGQRQRIGIARALALTPALVICDEPVSALDVSVRAQVINLLMEMQRRLGIAYLFISHDLSVVAYLCDRVLVMYLGAIVESGPRLAVWRAPLHPYTQALLAAAPVADPTRRRVQARDVLPGELPNPLEPPSGCAFHPRCPRAAARCVQEAPLARPFGEGRSVACHFAGDGSSG
jgi:oligopeptide/dipeptide ABC transporter ATP-binding protein